MRRTFGLGLAVALCGFALGCGKQDGPSGDGAAGVAPGGIEGNWTLVSTEIKGQALSAGKNPEKIRATATQLIAVKDGKEDPTRYRLNPSAVPAEIDLTETGDDSVSMLGIYKLEGNTLTICAVQAGKDAVRPKEFKTTKENGALMMTLTKD